MDAIRATLAHAREYFDALPGIINNNEGLVTLLGVMVAVALALITFRWPSRGWGVAILFVAIFSTGVLIYLSVEPHWLTGAEPFKTEIPSIFSEARGSATDQKAWDNTGQVIQLISGRLDEDSPQTYAQSHCMTSLAEFRKQIADSEEVSSADNIRRTLNRISTSASGSYCIRSWDEKSGPDDIYEIFVSIPASDGGKPQFAWLKLTAKKNTQNLRCPDYDTIRDTLINSAGLAPPNDHCQNA
ncbi:MAG: hypothetical protein JO261_08325 [Alphaproteobacteria bacterium]|nr:hypothetical protein [Alphaproteobacteria bacterium]MBV9693692.1 hypothetical protein [Alphaproteobacteria bacterium]